MRTIKVNLGERSYPIHVGAGLLPRMGEFLQQVGCRGKIAIVTNPTVAALYLIVGILYLYDAALLQIEEYEARFHGLQAGVACRLVPRDHELGDSGGHRVPF